MQAKHEGKSLAEVAVEGVEYHEGKPWSIDADAYFPCATQNELDEDAAKKIVTSAKILIEGANMPLTAAAAHVVQESGVHYVPGKAANAGGVAVSGLEMVQNASHLPWPCEKVEEELQKIMQRIHAQCVAYGSGTHGAGDEKSTKVDYVTGANRAAFTRVFSAMEKLGW